jgi:hypothetical protein
MVSISTSSLQFGAFGAIEDAKAKPMPFELLAG